MGRQGGRLVLACDASKWKNSWQATLLAEMLPRPFLWPVESTVAEHAQVTLNCTTSSSSKVLISWYKDGKRLQTQPGSYVGLDGILSLHDVTRNKAGIYTCEVTNSASTVTSNPSTIRMAYSSSLGPGGIAGIVIGSLALVALTGSLVGLFLYVCRQREKTPAETATVPSAPPAYENFPLPAQAHSVSPPYVENIYKSI